jgi:flagellar protein FliT
MRLMPKPATPPHPGNAMDPQLLSYYEAIERASVDMLTAARAGNWDEVVKLEGACVLLISQLKHAAQERPADPAGQAMDAAKAKSRIMQRILVNDAEIRHLAEPWLQDIDDTLAGRRSKSLH